MPTTFASTPASAEAASAAAVDLSGWAGLFFNERTGEPMRLVVNEGRLRIGNGPPLVAKTPDRFRPLRGELFFRSQDEFELRFVSPDEIEFKSMEGRTERYRRAQPYAHTTADVQAFDGRYHSEELGTDFEILPGTNGLVMRFEVSPEKSLELTPVERDTYMRSMMIVRFRRDASGKVTGFDYGNPVVRNITFTRLGDRTIAMDTSAEPAPVIQDRRSELRAYSRAFQNHLGIQRGVGNEEVAERRPRRSRDGPVLDGWLGSWLWWADGDTGSVGTDR